MTDTTGEFRGYDEEDHRVVVAWVNQDGSEYLVGLTHCCQATAKGSEAGIVCRRCYEHCSPGLGAEASVVRGPEDGTLMIVPQGWWLPKTEHGGFVVVRADGIAYGPGTREECDLYVESWQPVAGA